MKKVFTLLIMATLLAGVMWMGGCSSQSEPDPPAPSVEDLADNDLQQFAGQNLNLYVAAGMKKPMDVTIAAFEEASGAKVTVNYSSSGALFAQIQQNQPCDLYYTADWIYIDKLVEEDLLADSLKFLTDNLVLVVAPSAQDKVKSMQDLVKDDVSLVIGDGQAPVGVYADNALRELGLADQLGDNIKARPSTVNQIAIMVKEDQVDAGLIFSSVANGNELEAVEAIDDKYSGEIIFGTAVIKGGNTELATAFMSFAQDHAANFEQYGWRKYE